MGPKANLRKMIDSWGGEPLTKEEAETFNIAKLIGAPALVNVIIRKSAKQNDYTDIVGVTPVPEGMEAKEAVSDPIYFNIDKKPFQQATFDSLPKFIKDKIEKTDEYIAMGMPTNHVPAASDNNTGSVKQGQQPAPSAGGPPKKKRPF
jgi:hypothetical protein